MVRSWIVLLAVGVLLMCGFTAPRLPDGSRGIYHFENTIRMAARTQAGAVFSLTMGFKKSALAETLSHREKAQAILDKLEQRLASEDLRGVDISVSRVYPITREITLNVEVSDASRMEAVRDQLTRLLSDIPGSAFAGQSGVMRAD